MKGNHSISKHAFVEIVKTTKIWASKTSFKEYIVECVALIICVSLRISLFPFDKKRLLILFIPILKYISL